MPEPVFTDTEALAALCRHHAITRVSLFGSVLKGAAGPASDVDLLAEFMPGSKPGLMGLAAIEAEFSALLSGRRVDLRTAADLSRHFRIALVDIDRDIVWQTAVEDMPYLLGLLAPLIPHA
jgi:predicted nucleotidyltransferase